MSSLYLGIILMIKSCGKMDTLLKYNQKLFTERVACEKEEEMYCT